MGREGGPCRGVGGSQHLFREGFLSTGVQGESLPLAVGAALHFKQRSPGRIAVAYIGDGTWGEGSVYEALNMASLWQLPVLIVVENNGIAQTTPTSRQMAGTVDRRAAAFGVDHRRLTGYDVPAIRAELAPLVERVRAENLPLVVEFETVRLGPHSKGDDTRPVEEMAALPERDWCAAYARQDPIRFEAADRRQRRHVADIVEDVRRRQLSTWKAV
jgi:pyruvate dehydrogenase E1 component alpha subunit